MKFTIDNLNRIMLNKEVREALNCGDMLYMHIQDDSIVINNDSENAYRNMKLDGLNRIALSSEVVRFRLIPEACGELEACLENGQLIIPMSQNRDKAEIQYIRRIDGFNRVPFPEYLRQFINASVGSQVKYTKCDEGFIMSCDNTGEFFAFDSLYRVVVPAEIAKSGQVKIKYEENNVIISAA